MHSVKKTATVLCLAFFMVATFHVMGCGEKGSDDQIDNKTNVEIPVEENLGDCVGYEWKNIPRYPDCRRIEYTMDISLGVMAPDRKNTISYETKDAVQDIADFYNKEFPSGSGWEIKENNQYSFMIFHPDGAVIDVGKKGGAFDRGDQGKDWIVIDITCEYEPFIELKASDSTINAKEYPKPESQVTSYVEKQREVAGEDIEGTRPPGQNTVRIGYEKGANDQKSVAYLTDEPFNEVVSGYVSKGFVIMFSYVEEEAAVPRTQDRLPGSTRQCEAYLLPTNGEQPSVRVTYFSDKDGGATVVSISSWPV